MTERIPASDEVQAQADAEGQLASVHEISADYLRMLQVDITNVVDEAMAWPEAYRKVLAAIFLAHGQRLLGRDD